MVTEAIQATEPVEVPADQEVVLPSQTENAPVEGDVAAVEPDEAAALPEITLPEPEAEKPITRAEMLAEVERIRAEEREQAQREAQDALEGDRKRRQSENARREANIKREQAEREEINDSLVATLGSKGYHDIEPELVNTVIDRAFSKKEGHVASRVLSGVDEALDFYSGTVDQADLSPQAMEAARRIAPRLQAWINTTAETVSENAIQQGVPNLTAEEIVKLANPAVLKQIVDSQIAARNAAGRAQQTPLNRPEQAAAETTINNTPDARIDRIASGKETEDDVKWYRDREAAKAAARGR